MRLRIWLGLAKVVTAAMLVVVLLLAAVAVSFEGWYFAC